MNILITGVNGTVAPVLADLCRQNSHTVTAWDRSKISPDDPDACLKYMKTLKPDLIFHLAMGGPEWAREMADYAHRAGIPYLFTSTVNVFDLSKSGPYPLDKLPDAEDDYGRYKQVCEKMILDVSPSAIIARIGWQIGHEAGSNNMVDFLQKQQEEHGFVEASDQWIPSCSCLEDTAEGLYKLGLSGASGIYQLEGNPGLSFYEITSAIKDRCSPSPQIRKVEEFRRDNRMMDERIILSPITGRISIELN